MLTHFDGFFTRSAACLSFALMRLPSSGVISWPTTSSVTLGSGLGLCLLFSMSSYSQTRCFVAPTSLPRRLSSASSCCCVVSFLALPVAQRLLTYAQFLEICPRMVAHVLLKTFASSEVTWVPRRRGVGARRLHVNDLVFIDPSARVDARCPWDVPLSVAPRQ